jgi:hypothetical protein
MKPAVSRWIWIVPLILGIVSLLPVLDNEFTDDDHLLIESNPYVHSFDYLWQNLTRDYFYTPLGTYIGYYRPAVRLSFMLQYHFFGLNPVGYHVVSLAWFGLAIVLGYLLARHLDVPPLFAALGVSFFASHPGLLESVAIIASQADVMVVSAMLAGFICYIRWRSGKGQWWLVMALSAEIFGLASKETAVILAGLIFLWELEKAEFRIRRLRWINIGIFVLPVICYAVLRHMLGIIPIPNNEKVSISGAAIHSFTMWGNALIRALFAGLWPPYLHRDRPSPELINIFIWGVPGMIALCAAIWTFLKQRDLRWSIALLVLPLLPVLVPYIVRVTDDPRVIIVSDRWILMPALGAGLFWAVLTSFIWKRIDRRAIHYFILAMWGIAIISSGLQTRGGASLNSPAERYIAEARGLKERGGLSPREQEVVLLGDAYLLMRDNPRSRAAWYQVASIFERLIKVQPEDYMVRFAYGRALAILGKYDEAFYHVWISYHGEDPYTKKKVPWNDTLIRNRPLRAYTLGLIFEMSGKTDRARFYYKQSLSLDPNYKMARDRLASLNKK